MNNLVVALLEANRHQRHDFLNHLQVIWGYLALESPNKAIEYIKEVTDYLNMLQDINNIDNSQLATIFVVKILDLGFTKGFTLDIPEVWEVDERKVTKIGSFWDELWQIISEKILNEEFSLKISLIKEKIILDVHNIDRKTNIDWTQVIKLAKEYEFPYNLEETKIVIVI